MGRRPKPTALHVIEGTLHTTRHKNRKLEPKPVGDLRAAPAWMSEGQRRVWDDAVRHAPPGLLKKLDASALTTWVVARELHHRMVAHLAESGVQGLVYPKPPHGTLVVNPMVAAMGRQAQIMLRAAAELGFSPASRAKVSVSPDAKTAVDDPAEEYFN